MKKIAIIGSSGLGKEVYNLLLAINNKKETWEVIGFYDDAFQEKTLIINNIFCLGTIDNLINSVLDNISVVFAISERTSVYKIQEKFKIAGRFDFPNIIHPNVEITSGFLMGFGNVLASNSSISCDCSIGNFNLLNGSVGFGHDVHIGNFNAFMPRVLISGDVRIGNFNFFGMNSAVVQGKTIGSNNNILSYTLLTKTIKDERKYFGIPGKLINL